jgi:ParB/RepB/Spo0J family partition protein
MNDTKNEDMALEKIRPSKTNPRTHFDVNALDELTDSVRKHGILQALVVRPDWCVGKSAEEIAKVNGNAPTPAFHEIVAGERRYRAATTAKVDPVPVSVRLLSDQEALEEQLVENLQREDLDAFEEASGYRKLLDLKDSAGKAVHNIETIHDRTGKSRSRIYDRLKLLNAPKRMRDAVRGGLSVVIAEKVGALPTKEMRDAATAEILKPTDPSYGVGPMTVRQALEFIESNFMRQLSSAVFDQGDATLVPPLQDEQTGERMGGGICRDCPKRTGNMPALKGTKRPDVCTNTHCFALKTDAHFVRLRESAVASGKKVLKSEEAAKLFEDDDTLWFDSPWVLMSERPDIQEVNAQHAGKIPTWAKLLEVLESKPETVLAPTPSGKLAELVDRHLAIEAVNLAAKQKGEKSIFDKTSSSTSASSGSASSAGTVTVSDAEKKKREEAKIVFQVTLASFSALIAAIDDKGTVRGFWDELIRASITHAGHDGCWLICKVHGLDPKAKNKTNDLEGVEGAALEYGLTLPDEKLKLGYLVELLLSQRVKFANAAYTQGLKAVESFQAFVKLYKVDLDAVEKRIRAEANEDGKKGKTTQRPTPNAEIKKAAKQATPKATAHDWEKIADNKYRCKGCGAAAVKHDGKMLEEKAVRGKPCSKSEATAKTKKPARRPGLTASGRARLNKAMKDRWAARRKAAKKGGARK